MTLVLVFLMVLISISLVLVFVLFQVPTGSSILIRVRVHVSPAGSVLGVNTICTISSALTARVKGPWGERALSPISLQFFLNKSTNNESNGSNQLLNNCFNR